MSPGATSQLTQAACGLQILLAQNMAFGCFSSEGARAVDPQRAT